MLERLGPGERPRLQRRRRDVVDRPGGLPIRIQLQLEQRVVTVLDTGQLAECWPPQLNGRGVGRGQPGQGGSTRLLRLGLLAPVRRDVRGKAEAVGQEVGAGASGSSHQGGQRGRHLDRRLAHHRRHGVHRQEVIAPVLRTCPGLRLQPAREDDPQLDGQD